jgi:hypothetical protein
VVLGHQQQDHLRPARTRTRPQQRSSYSSRQRSSLRSIRGWCTDQHLLRSLRKMRSCSRRTRHPRCTSHPRMLPRKQRPRRTARSGRQRRDRAQRKPRSWPGTRVRTSTPQFRSILEGRQRHPIEGRQRRLLCCGLRHRHHRRSSTAMLAYRTGRWDGPTRRKSGAAQTLTRAVQDRMLYRFSRSTADPVATVRDGLE